MAGARWSAAPVPPAPRSPIPRGIHVNDERWRRRLGLAESGPRSLSDIKRHPQPASPDIL